MKKILRLLIPIALLFVIGCNDDEIAPTREEFLAGSGSGSSKTWKLTQMVLNDREHTQNLERCFLDDTYTFYENGDFIQDDNILRCDSLPIIINGVWKFKTDKTELYIYDKEIDTIGTRTNFNRDGDSIGFDYLTETTLILFRSCLVDQVLKDKIVLTWEEDIAGSDKKTFKATYIPVN